MFQDLLRKIRGNQKKRTSQSANDFNIGPAPRTDKAIFHWNNQYRKKKQPLHVMPKKYHMQKHMPQGLTRET